MRGERLWYVDTSVFLRAFLGHSAAALQWFNIRISRHDRLVSSYLLESETRRTLRNAALRQVPVPTEDELTRWLNQVDRIDVTRHLLDQAGRLDVVIKTADAIHIATAMELMPWPVSIITHDAQMARAVEMLQPSHPEISVVDPVSDDPGRGPVASG